MSSRAAEQELESGGATLFRQRWLPDTPARAKMLVVHGFGEHSGRYGNLVAAVLPLAVAVHGYDHRGHGRSSGQRGFIRRWSEFREDLATVLAAVEKADPATRTFLFGHSLGGLMALDFVLREKPALAGLVVSAPVLATPGVSPLLLALARLLSGIWPRFSLDARLDANALSRDPRAVEAYLTDPLVHSKGTARLSTELARTQRWVTANAEGLDLPLLVLHGAADAIAPPPASRALFARATSRDKERIEYPGGYHEPHNDTNRDEVVADLGRWLADRLE